MLQVLCDSSAHCPLVVSQACWPRPFYQPSKNYNMYPVNYTLYIVPGCWLLVSLIEFLSPLSGQRQTREQEEKEEDMRERGGDLVHLPIFLGLWSVGRSDSQTGCNLTMSTKVYNWNIKRCNMSENKLLGMHISNSNYGFTAKTNILWVYITRYLKQILVKCSCGTIWQAVASCYVSASGASEKRRNNSWGGVHTAHWGCIVDITMGRTND